MKNLLIKSISLMFTIAYLASCTPVEPHPSNEIISPNGLDIILEWKTGASSFHALQDADLDLVLVKGNNQVRRSEFLDSFETVHLEDVFSDGEYIVSVESHEITKDTEYTVYISDMPGNQVLAFTSNFKVGESDLGVN
ncbi:MAG: hypothetical protein M3512_16915, partial [Bacteroidota bacterium]|nr:hypothetical protein [Bacteroidota bacterium]